MIFLHSSNLTLFVATIHGSIRNEIYNKTESVKKINETCGFSEYI